MATGHAIDLAGEAILGAELSPDLIRAIDSASDANIEAFLDAYAQFRAEPVLGADELVPLIPSVYDFVSAFDGHAVLLVDNPRTLGLGGISIGHSAPSTSLAHGLRTLLLYCHRVAIEDPLMALVAPGGFRHDGDDALRASLISVLSSLCEFSQLLREGVLLLVENPPGGKSPGSLPLLGEWQLAAIDQAVSGDALSRALLGDGVDRLVAHLRTRADSPTGLQDALVAAGIPPESISDDVAQELVRRIPTTVIGPRAWTEQALAALAVQFAGAERGFDFYLPYQHCMTALKVLLGQPLGQALSADERIIASIADLQLPGIGDLPISDVVALRRGSEAFNQWRHALASGISKASLLLHDEDEPPPHRADAMQNIGQELQVAAGDISREMRQSTRLAGWLRGIRIVTVGALGASAHSGGWLATLIAGTAAATADDVLTSVSAKGRRPRALTSHYLLFRPDSQRVVGKD